MDTKKLRQKILDLAIRGKLVPQNPADEPASVLLERIKAEKEQLIKEGKIKRSKKSSKTTDTPHYGNVPFEVPSSWVWCKLDDLAFYKKGPFGSSLTKAMFVPKGDKTYKVYEQKNAIQKDEHLGTYYITEEKYQSLIGFAVQPYDIIVSCAGTIGESLVLSENPDEGIINQALMLIRLFNRSIERFYLLYFDYILKEEAYKESKGTAIKNIPPFDVLKNFYIPIPPLAEQLKIIQEVDKWFEFVDAIEKDAVHLHNLIAQAKSKILDLAIHGKLVSQDPTDEPAIELLKRINPDFIPCDNGHYENLPNGWCCTSINEMCSSTNGLWKGKKPPFINVGVIRNANFTKDFKLDYTKIEFIDVEQRSFEKRNLRNGDLIVEKSGGSEKNPVGRAILYEGKDNVYSFSNFTMSLRIEYPEILHYKYLYYLLLQNYNQGDMKQMQTQTTGLHNLILDKYLSIKIPLPPYKEQLRMVEKIEYLSKILDRITEEL
ncbi:restriction endonuclease subunit S [Parabacteroides faecis]|uniref:Type I restriction enzyme S subunit n=1 Tax=Parabacteroides faecis TaxID=1217282 RepID=A0ABR6KME1_9BACT|nr:restriction endonuclease subunit S [Parabacteroides faecis]MBB4622004.1 type I restriction enzyme S subunit [Parabacteroides faecis]GGJ82146.1 type I restriction endonuclease EcoAI [Parabacteroides faecis]